MCDEFICSFNICGCMRAQIYLYFSYLMLAVLMYQFHRIVSCWLSLNLMVNLDSVIVCHNIVVSIMHVFFSFSF